MNRNAELKRSWMPPRTTPMPRGSAFRSSPSSPGTAVITPSAQRTAGKGPDAKTRLLVLKRDGHACVCCGRSIIGRSYSLGHRLRASQGGNAVPSNLLTFLGWGGQECHGRIDSRRDPHDEAAGYTVRSWDDPAQVPVIVHGIGMPVFLAADGTYSPIAPTGEL